MLTEGGPCENPGRRQAKQRDSRRNQTSPRLDLELPASETRSAHGCCLSRPWQPLDPTLFPPEESEARCHTAWIGGRSRPQGSSFLSQRTYTNHTPESDLDAFPERRQEDDEKSNEQSWHLLGCVKGMGGEMIRWFDSFL